MLIETSCDIGIIAAGASKKESLLLYKYGYNVGMSFQIIDDILDFTASPKELGKPTGSDLIQGNITLPIFYAMNDASFYETLKALFEQPEQMNEQDIEHILTLLKETDALEQSYQLSNIYLRKSLQEMKKMPNNRSEERRV